MNEYLFYTTEGSSIAPNEQYDVENCQLLGFAKGVNRENALKTLLSENSWIQEAGFNVSEIISVMVLRNEM